MAADSMHASGAPLIQVRDLRVAFRLGENQTFEAVKGVSFDIPENSTVALVGESGSGKSVTALAILGLLPPENSIVDPAARSCSRAATSWACRSARCATCAAPTSR
jgi:ABC-type dipeptide/oligopeptide/nickel transport system ATPase component